MIPLAAIRKMNSLGQRSLPFFFAFDFEGEEAIVFTEEDLAKHDIYFKTGSFARYQPEGVMCPPPPLSIEPVPYPVYKRAFDTVRRHLLAGNSYLVNLTFPTRIYTPLGLDDIFHRSRAPYKCFWPGRFVVFSPEPFVRIRRGRISTYPMKGTIDASLPNAAERILADAKELAEHVTIVDLLRNDLNRVALQVRVERFRYIEHIQTNRKCLLQVSSEISGHLPGDYRKRLGDIFSALLPAGSVSGAPKAETLRIIREAEGAPRGFYTGVFGYFDGEDLESAVMIRFIEQGPDGLFFRSGGGITAFSDPQQEYRELLDKVYLPIE